MRELKFRGKKKDTNIWLFFDMTHHLSDDYGVAPDFLKYQLDTKTIGQFTGLKDKNGVEIYEGDVLELNNCGLLIVCFYKGEFKLQKLAEYHKKRNLYASISYLEFSVLRGNIYDNPELLTI